MDCHIDLPTKVLRGAIDIRPVPEAGDLLLEDRLDLILEVHLVLDCVRSNFPKY